MSELRVINNVSEITEFDQIELDQYMAETGCTLEEAIVHHNELATMKEEYDKSDEEIMDAIVDEFGHLDEDELEEMDKLMDEAIAEGEAEA